MKIFFCVKNSQIDILKDKPGIHKMSKIKLKFSKPKSISRKEFSSVSNIEFLEFNEDLRLANLYDRMMDKQLFEASFIDLDHQKLYSEYKTFNQSFFDRIKGQLEEDDLVIINDSSLFFLPKMLLALNVRVAIRNLRFDGTFIEKVPFYNEILENFSLSQKFFDDKESLDSFNSYILCSYEMREVEKNGCWYIKPYVDKFTVVDTLEHIKSIMCDKCTGERFDKDLIRYLHNMPQCWNSNLSKPTESDDHFNSTTTLNQSKSQQLNQSLRPANQSKYSQSNRYILTDANLLHLEPFIKNNPHIHVRYLRTSVELDFDDSSRMIQYLKKMYHNSFSIADPVNYSQIVAEMFFCDVFVGSQYSEIARLFGRPVIQESYDPFKLSKEVEDCIDNYNRTKYDVIGEEEYLREFLNVCGYDMVIDELSREGEMIEKLSDEIKGEKYEVFMKNGEMFMRKNQKKDEKPLSYDPIIVGTGSHHEIKNRRIPRELKLIDVEEVVRYWKGIRDDPLTILLDYDGTLTPIVEDFNAAVPSASALETLRKLNKVARVIVCSGRTIDKLDEWIPREIETYAEHGAFQRIDGKWKKIVKEDSLKNICKEVMQYYMKRTPGTRIEEKNTGMTFHYRQAKNFCVEKLYTLLRKIAGEKIQLGKCVVDLKGSGKDKICKEVRPVICIGDDKTDEDMFKECKGMSIKIGKGISYADGYLETVEDCIDLLERLLK